MGDIAQNFNRSEFACRCSCGFDTVDVELLDAAIDVRAHFGAAVHINDACRCPKHNADPAIKGAKNSQHLYGKAMDFTVAGVAPGEVASYLERRYPTSHGIFRYDTFTHLDVRPKKARGDFRKGASHA